MSDLVCAINTEEGIHTGPYWKDSSSDLIVCNRHYIQYEESRDETSSFTWSMIQVCVSCGTTESLKWWKCCEEHTPSIDPDLVCNACRFKLHAPKAPNRAANN